MKTTFVILNINNNDPSKINYNGNIETLKPGRQTHHIVTVGPSSEALNFNYIPPHIHCTSLNSCMTWVSMNWTRWVWCRRKPEHQEENSHNTVRDLKSSNPERSCWTSSQLRWYKPLSPIYPGLKPTLRRTGLCILMTSSAEIQTRIKSYK